MPICRDAQGQPLTAASPESARRLDEAVAGYLGARVDTRDPRGRRVRAVAAR